MGDGGVEAGEVKAIGSSAASLDVIEVPRQPGADASSEARGASAEASAPLPLCYNARVSPCVWPKRPATQPRPPPRPPPSPPCRTLPPSATAARALVRSHAYRPARRAAGSCLCGGQSRAGCRCSRRSRRPPGTPQGAAPRARRCGAGTTLQRPGPSRSRAPQGELRKDAPGGGETAAAEEREREGRRKKQARRLALSLRSFVAWTRQLFFFFAAVLASLCHASSLAARGAARRRWLVRPNAVWEESAGSARHGEQASLFFLFCFPPPPPPPGANTTALFSSSLGCPSSPPCWTRGRLACLSPLSPADGRDAHGSHARR